MVSLTQRNSRVLALSGIVGLIALCGGCASNPPPPQAPYSNYATASNDAAYGRSRDGQQNVSPPTSATMQDGTQKRVSAADQAAAQEYHRLTDQAKRDAYAAGVRDTMEEFKMRMEGRQGFVWQPPIIDYIYVPAAIVNGAFIPAHKAPVIVTPGRWIEENGVQVPAVNNAAPQQSQQSGSQGSQNTGAGNE